MSGRRLPDDIVDIAELARAAKRLDAVPTSAGPRRTFLAVWFRCCHSYGRMYRNAAGTEYAGRCPRCGAPVRALIGEGGTTQRTFEAR